MTIHSSIPAWRISWTEEPDGLHLIGSHRVVHYWSDFSSVAQLCSLRPHGLTAAYQASLSITNPQKLLKLMSISSVMPSNHIILYCPLLLLPSIFPSIRVFSNKSILIRWPNYWSFNFSIGLSNEYSFDFLQDWLVGFPCCPRDFQDSSPSPQFRSTNSSALRFL